MQFKKVVAVYSDDRMKPICTLCGKNAEFMQVLCVVTTGG
jgi:hypothetical protein